MLIDGDPGPSALRTAPHPDYNPRMGSTALEITPTLSIPDDELVERFVRASGAGGQNVNKVATAVELRFDVAGSPSLPDALRERLLSRGGEHVVVVDQDHDPRARPPVARFQVLAALALVGHPLLQFGGDARGQGRAQLGVVGVAAPVLLRDGAAPPALLTQDAHNLGTLMRQQRALRIGFLSAGGWDTHANQGAVTGPLANNLRNLAAALVQLRQDFNQPGDVIVVASEFGRTAAENGTRGTDHGHGNAIWLIGQRVAGGKQGSGDFPLLGGGDVNLYSLFVERAQALAAPGCKHDGLHCGNASGGIAGNTWRCSRAYSGASSGCLGRTASR